jgi:spore coat polysaccharide biosynthesis protein SpsF
MDKCCVIIQARMGSTRRPGKINFLFNDEPMLAYQINRLKAFGIHNIIIATSQEKEDNITERIALNSNVTCFRGSEADVLKRFYDCSKTHRIDIIIRVGGDDPLIDPEGIKFLHDTYKKNQEYDLIYTSHQEGWIYGTAAELFTFDSLQNAHIMAKNPIEREHIIPYYKNNDSVKKMKLNAPKEINRKDIYMSVDYQEDLDLIKQILEYFTNKKKRYSFTQKELIKLYDSNKLIVTNKHLHNGF